MKDTEDSSSIVEPSESEDTNNMTEIEEGENNSVIKAVTKWPRGNIEKSHSVNVLSKHPLSHLSSIPEEIIKKIADHLFHHDKINFMQVCKLTYKLLHQNFITLSDLENLIYQYYPIFIEFYKMDKKYNFHFYCDDYINVINEIHQKYDMDSIVGEDNIMTWDSEYCYSSYPEMQKLLSKYEQSRKNFVLTYGMLLKLLENYNSRANVSKILKKDDQLKTSSKFYSITEIKRNPIISLIGLFSLIFFVGSVAGISAISILALIGKFPSGETKCYNSTICQKTLTNTEIASVTILPLSFLVFGSIALCYFVNADIFCIKKNLKDTQTLYNEGFILDKVKNSPYHKAKKKYKLSKLLESHSLFNEKTTIDDNSPSVATSNTISHNRDNNISVSTTNFFH